MCDILMSVPNIDKILDLDLKSIFENPDSEDPRYLIGTLLRIDSALNNILEARKRNPINNGVGCLYLDEVYKLLNLLYLGDRNIGITSNDRSWHVIDVAKELKLV